MLMLWNYREWLWSGCGRVVEWLWKENEVFLWKVTFFFACMQIKFVYVGKKQYLCSRI